MSGDVHTPTNAGPGDPPPGEGVPAPTPPPVDAAFADEDERPEILVGAAFAGGLAAALILKWLTSDDD